MMLPLFLIASLTFIFAPKTHAAENTSPTKKNGQKIQRNDRPVIGVFTHPYVPDISNSSSSNDGENQHYIAASYVKWLESAGARTIPIHQNLDLEELNALFLQINGVLFPGGGDTQVPNSAARVWNLANEYNRRAVSLSDTFPIWGTCDGFEWILQLASDGGDKILQNNFQTIDISLPLQIMTDKASNKNSNENTLFSNPKLLDIVTSQNVTYNHHEYGIEPDRFEADSSLNGMFQILSTNEDSDGRLFVSSMEARDAKRFPYFGVQWHPEKNNFEYGTVSGTDVPLQHINHSQDAIFVSQQLATFFVTKARKNGQRYVDVDRFPLVWEYEMRGSDVFEQIFIIPDPQLVSQRKKTVLRGMNRNYVSEQK